MNDMARQPSAARLSEDIGDVLSAIRRLIAEDEALTAARDQREESRQPSEEMAEPAPQIAVGDTIAHRYGGNAALARRMAAMAQRPQPVEDSAGETGEAVAAQRFAELAPLDLDAADADTPLHPFEAALLAAEDGAVDGTVDEAPELPALLRLRDQDRVIRTAATTENSPPQLKRVLPWRPFVAPQPEAATLDVADLSAEDESDFADAFDRLNAPVNATPAATASVPEATAEPAETPATAAIAAEPDAVAAEDMTPAPTVAAPAAAEVRAEPAAPARLLRRTSRWARIEPPLSRQRTRTDTETAAPEITTATPLLLQTPAEAEAVAEAPIETLAETASDTTDAPMIEATAEVVAIADETPAPVIAGPADTAPAPEAVEPAEIAPALADAVETAKIAPTPVALAEPVPARAGARRLADLLRGDGEAATVLHGGPVPARGGVVFAELAPAPIAVATSPAPAPADLAATALKLALEAAQTASEARMRAETAAERAADLAETASAAQTQPDLGAGLGNLIREIIQEELHGELGQRFARNLRAVIRREVAGAIEDQLDRL